jgi:hypothetical protein
MARTGDSAPLACYAEMGSMLDTAREIRWTKRRDEFAAQPRFQLTNISLAIFITTAIDLAAWV